MRFRFNDQKLGALVDSLCELSGTGIAADGKPVPEMPPERARAVLVAALETHAIVSGLVTPKVGV